jgi:hypothetical protein
MTHRFHPRLVGWLACLLLLPALPALAQQQQILGIYVDAEGLLDRIPRTETAELERLRRLAATRPATTQPAAVGWVSLRQSLDSARAAVRDNRPLPDDVRYLRGLTQLRYIVVDPARRDILLGGPLEPYDATNPLQPIGRQSRRPVCQWDDLVVVLRAGLGRRAVPFGCSIDPPPDAVDRGLEVQRQNPNTSPVRLAQLVAEAMGPHQVRLFGIPADTRAAFVCVAADYRMKGFTLGIDPTPVPGAGMPVDATRAAGNGFWFEAAYGRLLVSPAGDIFELRGPRLSINAGALPFDPRGATERALAWARAVSAGMDRFAAASPLFADLQNLADLALLAALMRRDRLPQTAGLDLTWLLDETWQPAKVPTPRTARVRTNITAGSLVAGGVRVDAGAFADPANREVDSTGRLSSVRQGAGELR